MHTLSTAQRSPLLDLVRRVAEAGCSLADARASTVGGDVSLVLLARGPWDAIAKLENALNRMAHNADLHLVHYRARSDRTQSRQLPYVVEIIAADKNGLLVEVLAFFAQRQISIEQLTSMRYQAMQTHADMFQAQITIGIPADSHIAALRDDFLELCDSLNLDAIMDPVKY